MSIKSMSRLTLLSVLVAACSLPRPPDVLDPNDAGPICAADTFLSCDGDQLHRCNSDGSAEEIIQCELGCNPSIGGCNLCTPSHTDCTNGTVASCDADGNVITMHACPLGCFQDQPRCTDVDPSNNLGQYLDLTTQFGVDLDLTDGAVISTIDGTVKNGNGASVSVPSYLVNPPPNGVPIRVFIVKSAHLRDVTFAGPSSQDPTPGFGLVSNGAIVIDGVLDASPSASLIAPGSFLAGACVGHPGTTSFGSLNQIYVSGSGGAGHATSGGAGGQVGQAGGAGGQGFANADLTPLRGGCAGGGELDSGGGAIQLVSRERIDLLAGAVIDANGSGAAADPETVGGGGSGGGILLEAPVITLADAATLVANGGGGASGQKFGSTGLRSTAPAPGGQCPNGTSNCGVGGAGGAALAPPTNGADVTLSNANGVHQLAGGGGGSVGYIRINTGSGTYAKTSSVIESPTPTTANVRTR